MKPGLRRGDALLIVDVQSDFCAGGALEVPDGDAAVPALNRWIADARNASVPVYASRDWHPRGHPSFEKNGGQWPAHCVQDTRGASFHPDLQIPDSVRIVSKGTRFDKDQYSAFDETGLASILKKLNVKRVWIGGLALDVCVRATALDACRSGLEVRLIKSATRPVTPEGGEEALLELLEAGISIAE